MKKVNEKLLEAYYTDKTIWSNNRNAKFNRDTHVMTAKLYDMVMTINLLKQNVNIDGILATKTTTEFINTFFDDADIGRVSFKHNNPIFKINDGWQVSYSF